MKAADIMSREVITIRGIEPVIKAIQVMQQHGVRSLIVDRRHPADAYGILTETDIVGKVVAYGKNPRQVRVYEIMTKPCIMVSPDLQVEYVARLLTQHQIRVCPVIDGQLLGLVSMTDILTKVDFSEQSQTQELADKIQVAIAQAQAICGQANVIPEDCIAAWRQVEDLQAEAAYQQAAPLDQTAFEQFRETGPDWLTSADYDTWCGG